MKQQVILLTVVTETTSDIINSSYWNNDTDGDSSADVANVIKIGDNDSISGDDTIGEKMDLRKQHFSRYGHHNCL